MPTKKELEARIAELEAIVEVREKTIKILSSQDGMEITLPACPRDTITGDAPHLSFQEGLTERLIKILEPALRKHGGRLSCTSPVKSLRMHDNMHRCQGDTILVPAIWGEVMAEIIDAAAEFGRLCYAEGVKNGSNLLIKMSRGEITADALEDGVEKAIRRQERRDVCVLIKSNAKVRDAKRSLD